MPNGPRHIKPSPLVSRLDVLVRMAPRHFSFLELPVGVWTFLKWFGYAAVQRREEVNFSIAALPVKAWGPPKQWTLMLVLSCSLDLRRRPEGLLDILRIF